MNIVTEIMIGGRNRLSIFFSEPGALNFTDGCDICNGYDPVPDLYMQFSYPAACEMNGRLYVIYTMPPRGRRLNFRGAMLTSFPIE